jgi:RNA polymerase sigma factor (sigma-70 family)
MVPSTRDRVLRLLSGATHRGDEPDAQLLRRFVRDGDDGAFEALLRRHAGLVWSVARRSVGHEQDAEDVFQATFLVLARQAAQVRRPESLASWLHGTALRMARRAKRTMARRHTHEERAARAANVEVSSEPALRELQAVLDEEVQRLPEKYRAAFTLCVLEGRSREEAAAALGYEPGTVAVHLCRARQRLQRELARRGVALAAVLTAADVGESASAAPAVVVRAALRTVRGPAEAVSAQVAALVQGTVAGNATNHKLLGILLLTASLAAVCAGAHALTPAQPARAEPPPASGAKPALAAKPADAPVAKEKEKDKTTEVRGRVLGPDGKPVAGAKVVLPVYKKQDDYDVLEVATADDEGNFAGMVPAAKNGTFADRMLVARAAGFGPDWLDLDAVPPKSAVTFKLVKADVVVRGRVLTLEGKPVAGATVRLAGLSAPNMGDLTPVFKLWRTDPRRALTLVPKQLRNSPATGLPRAFTTDKEGRFEIKGAGDDRLLSVSVEGDAIERTSVRIATVADFDPKTLPAAPKLPPGRLPLPTTPPLYGPVFDHPARPTQVVTGVARDKKTGKPLANVGVTGVVPGSWENSVHVRTDAEGRYRLVGLPKAAGGRLTFYSGDKDTTYLGQEKTLPEAEGLAPITADVELVRGVVITGRVTDRETGKAITGGVRYVPLSGNKELAKLPGQDIHLSGVMTYPLDADGRFRIVAPPGLGVVLARAEDRVRGARPYTQAHLSPDDLKKPYFKVEDGLGEIFLSAAGHLDSLLGTNDFRVIEPAEGADPVTVSFALDPGKSVTGRIEDADGKPVAGATVTGLGPSWARSERREDATFTAVALDPDHPRIVAVIHPQRKLAAVAQLRGDEKEPVVRLRKWSEATGQVQDADGKPLAGVAVRVMYRDHSVAAAYDFARIGMGVLVTDKDGKFRVDLPFGGQEFRVLLMQGERYLDLGKQLDKVSVAQGEAKDLGAVKVKVAEP